ncbi:hypothetical protein BH790_gp56 [Gordonia phage Gsput1]|uniref:Uncharacterized protein n=1 Tax=Gordonia phage Gsput1 TaxID=1622193 RepID=A0A0E3T6A1_9CAUD|nr:hypothetical protein BH790_gp56 [Gordonia phage Gsput1]AKC03081.1 hypothetical protein Gsput1_56 [Gordonia phage Gsput1]
MVKCAAGEWLDDEDVAAIERAISRGRSMAEIHRQAIRIGATFKLTTFKDHVRARCVCNRK